MVNDSSRTTLLAAADARGALGFDDAVTCFGAGGGLRSPGTYSRMGANFSETLLRPASRQPSGRGIHVPIPGQYEVPGNNKVDG
jgi:hypothetical protein